MRHWTGERRYILQQYVCAGGYVMDKASSDVSRGLECRNDRTWSGKVPQCHGKFIIILFFSFISTYDKQHPLRG